MSNEAFVLPPEIDDEIVGIYLRSMESKSDILTPEQITDWDACLEGP